MSQLPESSDPSPTYKLAHLQCRSAKAISSKLCAYDYFSSTNNKDFTVNMDSIKEAANKAGENIRQGVDNIKESLQTTGHQAQESADRAAHGSSASSHTPGNVAQEKFDQAKHSLGQTGEQLKHRAQEAGRDIKHS